MSRQIKRLPLSFNWPMGIPWKGYHHPYSPQPCKACSGSGNNPEYKNIKDQINHLDKRWLYKLTQDEVQALYDAGRLDKSKPCPSVKDVNVSPDPINQFICVQARAKRFGISLDPCGLCDGHGHLWPEDKYIKLSADWERIEPPIGEGYQLWSNEAPASPVYDNIEALAEWLVENDVSTFGKEMTGYRAWLRFIVKSVLEGVK